MPDEHVDHPMLQDLEGADRCTELLSCLGIFQRHRVQFTHCTDRLCAERADGVVAAGFQRGNALAFLTQQLALDAAQADLGGAAAVDGLETLQMQIGSTAIDHEQADAAAIAALPGGAGGDDQIVSPGRCDDGALLAGQDVVLALTVRRGRDLGEIEARGLLRPGERPDLFARDDVGEERTLLLLRSRLFDQAACNYNRLDERLDDQMTAEFLHDDHRREGSATKSADLFGKRRSQQAELGKGLPTLAAKTFFGRDNLAAGIEIVLVAQQALDAGSQQFLLFRVLYVHPILSWYCS